MARVSYVEKDSAPEGIREMFEKMEANGFQVLNLYKAVAHCPRIGLDFLRLGNKILFRGSLSPRLRELAILRVGALARAPYEVTKHAAIGLESGLSQAHIDAVADWRAAAVFDARERAVLAYTDEVSRHYRVADGTFAAVRDFLDEEGVVELTLVIGYYELVCRVLEALQIELEDYAFETIGRTWSHLVR